MSESEGLLEREYRNERALSRREPLKGFGRLSVSSEPMGSIVRKFTGGFPRGLLNTLRTAKETK